MRNLSRSPGNAAASRLSPRNPISSLRSVLGSSLRVVFPALPKGFLHHRAPPFLVVAVVARLVDLRHGAHMSSFMGTPIRSASSRVSSTASPRFSAS